MSNSARWRQFRPYLVPAAIAVAAALAELGGEPLRLMLRYERTGLAAGELYRLLTGHLVHLGPSHMAMNVLALAVLAAIFRGQLRPSLWLAAGIAAALAIDGGLFWFSESVDWYVGLSGVLHGFWAAGGIMVLSEKRVDGLVLLALLAVKLGYEAIAGPVPLTGAVAAGPVIAVAHAYGAAGGAVAAIAGLAVRRREASL